MLALFLGLYAGYKEEKYAPVFLVVVGGFLGYLIGKLIIHKWKKNYMNLIIWINIIKFILMLF